MGLRHCKDYIFQEHKALLALAGRIENLLASASNSEYSQHAKTLAELHALDHELTGITEHCHASDRLVEAAYYKEFRQEELARIQKDHLQIMLAVANFREELKCATPDRTMAMIVPGMDVVKLLRDHVTFEAAAFNRVADHVESRARASIRGDEPRKVHKRRKTPVGKRKAPKAIPDAIPYTLEPHPEL